MEITLLLLLSIAYLVCAGEVYNFPQLRIKVLKPKGLKVVLPFTPGDQYFSFHANVNEPIPESSPGQISADTDKKHKGRWIVRDFNVELKAGDEIHYWIFVQHDSLGYRSKGSYHVNVSETDDETLLTTRTSCTVAPNPVSTICERVVVNLTDNLLNLQQELDALRNTKVILDDLINKDEKLSKTLYLDGLVANDIDTKMVVPALIKDKLGLPFSIENVERQKSGTVVFQVGNLEEKIEIIKAAKTKLVHSQYKIFY